MGIRKPFYLEDLKIPTIKYCRILKYPLPLQHELEKDARRRRASEQEMIQNNKMIQDIRIIQKH